MADQAKRYALLAEDPATGGLVFIGPVGSMISASALRNMLDRHGWSPGAPVAYMSRAELVRKLDAPRPMAKEG